MSVSPVNFFDVPTGVSSIWRRVLVVCGMSAVAFAAPLLDIYGRTFEHTDRNELTRQ